jgi:murein DD-endopeptidase MepM/ murein hydrolase activator NlpD
MTIKKRRRGRIIPALLACFYAGLAVGWWVHAAVTRPAPDAIVEPRADATTGERDGDSEVRLKPDTTSVLGSPDLGTTDLPTVGADPIAELRRHALRLPVDAADVDRMKGSFDERRGGGSRGHEAVDILADRHTPVRAVEDGRIAKLFFSKAGGTTIYQFDPTERYCYYYAHLDRYAGGLREGQAVSRGDILGYVGTTGNAPPDTPHLHFAIFQLTDEKRWWEGRAIDPYRVFK